MKKYYATYNVNFGGCFSRNENYHYELGDFEGDNLREMKKRLNGILRAYNARKNSPFGL